MSETTTAPEETPVEPTKPADTAALLVKVTAEAGPTEAPPESTQADEPAPAETVDQPVDDTARPWHGTTNPLESLWQHFTAEIAALKAKLSG